MLWCSECLFAFQSEVSRQAFAGTADGKTIIDAVEASRKKPVEIGEQGVQSYGFWARLDHNLNLHVYLSQASQMAQPETAHATENTKTSTPNNKTRREASNLP